MSVATHDEAAVRAPAAARGVEGRRARRTVGASVVVAPLIVLLVFLTVWWFVAARVLPPKEHFLLPTPQRVFASGFWDGDHRRALLDGLRSTAHVAVVGFVIASALGFAAAVVMRQSRWLQRALYPYLVVVDTVPTLALVPLIGFLFGYGFHSRVIVCVMVSLFPMVNNTSLGLRSTDRQMLDLFQLGGAGRWTRLRLLELPGALPSIFTGLRIGAPLAVISAVVSDFFFRSGEPGIGRLIFLYRRNLASEQLFAAVIAASLLGLLFYAVVSLAAALVVPKDL